MYAYILCVWGGGGSLRLNIYIGRNDITSIPFPLYICNLNITSFYYKYYVLHIYYRNLFLNERSYYY